MTKKKTAKRKVGRPSTYNKEITEKICLRIAGGESLRAICSDKDLPHVSTILEWLHKHEEFAEQYAHARNRQADHFAEEIIEISDNEKDPQKARIRVDARKWYAGKVRPKKWGETSKHEITGADGERLIPEPESAEETARKLAFILQTAARNGSNEPTD